MKANLTKTFKQSLDKTLKTYQEKTKIEENILQDYLSQIENFIFKVSETQQNLDRFSKLFSAFVKITPIVGTITSTILINSPDPDKPVIVTILILTVSLAVILNLLELKFPKDIEIWKTRSTNLEMMKSLRIMASQIALYSSIMKVSHDENKQRIQKLSEFLKERLTDSIKNNWNVLVNIVDLSKRNDDFNKTEVFVTGIKESIYEKLTPVAEIICEVCGNIFGLAKYTVKIYLKTEDIYIEDTKVEMLTSLVKYPFDKNHNKKSSGRSWVNCRGGKSFVWECLLDKEILCFKNLPKHHDQDEFYPSIVFIRLPEGIGVLTIESSNENTFAEKKNISEDVKTTLMIATNALIKEALDDLQ